MNTENGAGAMINIRTLPVEGTIGPGVTIERMDVASNGTVQTKGVQKVMNAFATLVEAGVMPELSLGNEVVVQDSNVGKLRYPGLILPDGTKQYMRVRGGRYVNGQLERTNIVSGMCLMSVGGGSVVHEDGTTSTLTMPGMDVERPVTELRVDPALSYYEVETLERLTRTIGAVSAFSEKPTSLAMNIPRVEYYLYAMEPFAKGLMTRDQMLEWIAIVDERSARIRSQFSRRADRYAKGTLRISNQNILDGLDEYVVACLRENCVPDLDIMQERLSQEYELADSMLRRRRVNNFGDLNYFGYVYTMLQAGAEEGAIALGIENPTEEMIMNAAEKDAERLNMCGLSIDLAALYVFPQLVYQGNQKGLYFKDGSPSFDEAKEMLRLFRFYR